MYHHHHHHTIDNRGHRGSTHKHRSGHLSLRLITPREGTTTGEGDRGRRERKRDTGRTQTKQIKRENTIKERETQEGLTQGERDTHREDREKGRETQKGDRQERGRLREKTKMGRKRWGELRQREGETGRRQGRRRKVMKERHRDRTSKKWKIPDVAKTEDK